MHLAVGNGALKSKLPANAEWTARATPGGVISKNPRPVFSKYRRTVIINGRFSPGVAYRDNLDLFSALGIQAPAAAPTVAKAGVGQTGNIIMYYTWAEYSGATLVHQGNTSPASATLVCTNEGIHMSAIPAVAPDARATHWRVFASVDGDVPKFIDKVTVGTTTFDWTVQVRSTETVPVNADGTINVSARGVPPYCYWSVTYHDRTWYGGDPNQPQRVWYSLIDEPESVSPYAYYDTLDREANTGLGVFEDSLVIFVHDAIYSLQGYSAGTANPDFTMRKVEPSVGCVSHYSVVNLNGRLWFASRDGIYMFDGRAHSKMKELERYWRDAYAADLSNYENSIAIGDHIAHVYKLLIPSVTASFYYVAAYDGAEDGEAQPSWSFDRRNRIDTTMGKLWTATDRRGKVYTGSSDGIVREENVAANSNDDGDTYNKQVTIRTKHFFFGDQGGFRAHGRTIREILLYLKSESQGFTVSAYGGDDPARDASGPTWGPYSFAAMALAGAVPETVKPIRPTGLSGAGVTVEITVTSPVGFEYRGITITPIPGPRFRGVTT